MAVSCHLQPGMLAEYSGCIDLHATAAWTAGKGKPFGKPLPAADDCQVSPGITVGQVDVRTAETGGRRSTDGWFGHLFWEHMLV